MLWWKRKEPEPEPEPDVTAHKTIEALRRLEVVTDRLEVVSARFESRFHPDVDTGDTDDRNPD